MTPDALAKSYTDALNNVAEELKKLALDLDGFADVYADDPVPYTEELHVAEERVRAALTVTERALARLAKAREAT